MSQPPKSTMRAPSLRWASFSTVFFVMASCAAGGKAAHYRKMRARPHGTGPGPPHAEHAGALLDGGDEEARALGAGDADRGAGREVGTGDRPERVGDARPALAVDDR